MAYCLLRFPRLSCIIKHECDLVAGLIPVPVAVFAEHRIQFQGKFFFSSHALHQSVWIMWHIPCVMARSSFCNKFSKQECILFFQERAVGISSLCIACLWVNHIAIILSTYGQQFVIFVLLKLFGYLGEDKVIVGIFQRA